MSDETSPSLTYQLDLLKLEIETINAIIGRHDEITQTTKNWAVVTWAGGVGLCLQHQDLRVYLILTAIIPLLFWFIDAQWRRLQARSTFRVQKIREFLNDDRLTKSFAAGRLYDFVLFDPVGTQYRNTSEYRDRVSLKRTLRYAEVKVFYSVPMLISIVLGIYFLWTQARSIGPADILL
jgi:hypothetical protein